MALVVILVAIVGISTYFAYRSFLYDRLDQQVQSVGASNAGRLGRCVAQEQNECVIGDGANNGNGGSGVGYGAPQTEWVVVVDATGSPDVSFPIRPSDSLRQMKITTRTAQAIVAGRPGAVRSLTTSDGTELRVTVEPLPGNGVFVLSGLPTDEVQRAVRRLIAIELLIGGGAVAVAIVATTLGVRRSLRNLYRVTGTAQEVAAELSPTGSGLDRRVPVVEEGTEVGQLAESFNTMLAAVQTQFAARLESEERMRQFMADASHELRTPLTSIRGYAELARMQRAVGETADDNLARIEADGTRMSRLIEDLLLLARGEADGRPAERRLVDVAELVDDAVSGARAAYPERQIDAEVSGDPHVVGDGDQLLRAVRNLINNAAVHTDPARPILVRAWPDPDGVTVQVVDGGPGLPPEQAARVFERFWRADKARSRARGGTGLGMSIVASIVRAHGGAVWFDSSVENGSTVTVRLPAAHAE